MNRLVRDTLTERVLAEHLVGGRLEPGELISLRMDQALLHDVGGTMIMLELEALGTARVAQDVAVIYIDHNLLQLDARNADDHQFLRLAATALGLVYSPPGNGISHVVHVQRFGRPGATLVGCDSHTPGAGALGMFALAAGGLVVAVSLSGVPFELRVPKVWGVELRGRLPDWVSAKDVILELLRRHGVAGANGHVVEYFGDGLAGLSVMDRQVIANMGTELGAVTSIFPSDSVVRDFLVRQGRGAQWRELAAGSGANYSRLDTIDLSSLVPLIALPYSPGNVVPVEQVAGLPVGQVIVGSSANPGFRDFAVVAHTLDQAELAPATMLEINPSSRQVAIELSESGLLTQLVRSGARLNQAGCLGCCGTGQAAATGVVSLRTFPRNFNGRSGEANDRVHLCSPETAVAAAIAGQIVDPRQLAADLGLTYRSTESAREHSAAELPMAGPGAARGRLIDVPRGPYIKGLPPLPELPDELVLPVALVLGDDVSTDDIMPAGAEVLALRSDVSAIARYVFRPIDPGYLDRVAGYQSGHAVLAGANYGQGSAREHAALAPRYLGLRVVVARGFARVHVQNLVAWGILPLELVDPADYPRLGLGTEISFSALRGQLASGQLIAAGAAGRQLRLRHRLAPEEIENILAGGVIPRYAGTAAAPAQP